MTRFLTQELAPNHPARISPSIPEIPVQNDNIAQISTILLDEEYFSIIQSYLARTESGASVINPLANICLKARAHRELFDKKTKGGQVDDKDIKKHRNDILRIAPMLKGNENIALGIQPKADLRMAIEKLKEMSGKQFGDIMKTFPGVKQTEIFSMIERVFLG